MCRKKIHTGGRYTHFFPVHTSIPTDDIIIYQFLCIYICIYIHIHTQRGSHTADESWFRKTPHTYIERERERVRESERNREKDSEIYMYICMFMYIYPRTLIMHAYVSRCIHTRSHTHTYTHTHTHTPVWLTRLFIEHEDALVGP